LTTQKKLPVSVCLISGAEAHRLGRALASVAGWTSETIVVLNEEVSDGTDKVASGYGAQVFREPWRGFAAQKNSAAQKATQPWVLSLDADEEVSPALRAEIERALSEERRAAAPAAFEFPRCTFYCGRWIRHGDWYPDRVTRLWRKELAVWEGVEPHPRLAVRGAVGRLRADLLHFSQESINRQVVKTVNYADEFARHCAIQGRRTSFLDLLIRPVWRFVRAYFLKLGFLDGWQGYTIAWLTAFYTFLRYVRAREDQMNTDGQR
jgi:glycosyltransferase involved in cell wall biosynthesis